MLARFLPNNTHVELAIPHFADELFLLTDKNRVFLRQWLGWVDNVQSAKDTRSFLDSQLQRFTRNDSLDLVIFHDNRIAGVAGFYSLDLANGIGTIGYWLGEEFNGMGIMTEVVRELILIGQELYSLQRLEIRCATENTQSRAIPERLGFTHESTMRRAEKLFDEFLDHEVYVLLL